MKKLPLLALYTFIAASLFAQGIPVSHTPENKNVVIEEYTGIHCVACPNGHKTAREFSEAHPGDVVIINMHAGGYAEPNPGEPDYRTPEGEYIANQSGLTGYPSASFNRHVFPNYADTPGETAIFNRSYWASAGNQILTENAAANLGVEASIDVQSNLLTVHVQVYYTATPSSSTNRLYVALLQDSLVSLQSGAAAYNPAQVLPNGNYVHLYMLRKMISGISGRAINTGIGTTVNEYFTYTIPDSIKNTAVIQANLKVAAYLTEGTQEVITGHTVLPTFTNFPGANNSKIFEMSVNDAPLCGFTAAPVVKIQNFGSNALTSLYIDYSINGSSVKNYYWTGDLSSTEKENVTLPGINFFPQSTNSLTVSTRLPNGSPDGDNSDDEKTATFSSAPDVDNNVTMTLQLDYYGAEVTWEVVNSVGTELYSGGPYSNVANPNTGPPLPAPITATFNLASGDCYDFVTHDTYKDGILGNGTGFTLKDANNMIIVTNYSKYESGGKVSFGVDVPQPDSSDVFIGIVNAAFTRVISVYPNPVSGKINLSFSFAQTTALNVSLTNVLGQTVINLPKISGKSDKIQLDTDRLATGVYFLNVSSGDKNYTEKILIQD